VAWDFGELPSQIMENLLGPESLDFFARHHETGKPIRRGCSRKCSRRAISFRVTTMRQLAFGKMDLELHIITRLKERGPRCLIDEHSQGLSNAAEDKTATTARRFNPRFRQPIGYAAGYYSYKWAEVLDAGLLQPVPARRRSQSQTATPFATAFQQGEQRTSRKLFRDFMGRDPDLNALLARSGLS
jgi:oligopeptidase A